MPVVWGLDLREMQWAKFKSSYMWGADYHLRRTKFAVYQAAMVLCVCSESVGTAALSDYVDQQAFVEAHARPPASVRNDNFIGAASFNIFVGIFVATIFGAAFFFDLFWPERRETRAVQAAWRACSLLASAAVLADAVALTVIVAARAAVVTGTDASTARRVLAAYAGSPLRYRDNGRAVASAVLLWPGAVATWASTALLWHSLAHIARFGPKSAHARAKDPEQLAEKPPTPTPEHAAAPAAAGNETAAGQADDTAAGQADLARPPSGGPRVVVG